MTEARTADLWLKIDQLHLRFLQVVLNSQGVFWHKLSYFNTYTHLNKSLTSMYSSVFYYKLLFLSNL